MSGRIEDLRKPSNETVIGEAGEISPIEQLALEFEREGVHCVGIPLGGTFGMVKRENPITKEVEWVSQLPGAYDSDAHKNFNARRIPYNLAELYLDIEPHAPHPSIYDESLSRNNGRAFSPLRLTYLTYDDIAREGRLWQSLLYPQALDDGEHSAELLATDRQGSMHYTDLLFEELVSGKYPRGVRLDSSELVDEDSFAIFSAVNCGIVFPEILEAAERITGGIERTEKGLTRESVEKLEKAFQKMTVLISMGSDQKRIAHAFYNTLAHLTGLSFVIISSNSSYGVAGGDAETNLKDISTVTRAINEGKLPRGVAYDVGDGLVSTDLLEKMKPEASTLQTPMLATDGKFYGATFLAYHARPISEIHNSPWYFDKTSPQIPDLLLYLSFRPQPDVDSEYFDLNPTAYNASQLAELLTSVTRVSVDNIPDKLPMGTRFVLIEGPGRANAPTYTIRKLQHAANQLEARTNGEVKPIFIVASECPFPFATEEYGASIVSHLKQSGEYVDRVVNAKSLPPHIVRSLIALRMYKTVDLSRFGFPEERDELARLGAKQIQVWVDEYISTHNLSR